MHRVVVHALVAVAYGLLAPNSALALESAVVDHDSRFTVAVCDSGGAGGTCVFHCSGVLVAPRVVLTARHCLTRRATSMPNCADDVEGAVLDPPARFGIATDSDLGSGTRWIRAASIAAPLGFAPCGDDLALLTLDSPLADSPSPVEVDLSTGALSSSLRLAGYGASDATGGGSGTRRRLDGAKVACRGGESSCRAFEGGPNLVRGEVLIDARACAGDSGGGAFSGTPAVAAILSRSDTSSGTCGTAVFTALDRHALLLARVARAAAEVDGVAPPAWVLAAEQRGNGPGRGLGVTCDDDADCDSRLCRSRDAGRTFVCAMPCQAGRDACPCESTGAGSACFVERSSDGGGNCGVSASSSTAPAGLVLLLGALVTRRRRRTRAGQSDGLFAILRLR